MNSKPTIITLLHSYRLQWIYIPLFVLFSIWAEISYGQASGSALETNTIIKNISGDWEGYITQTPSTLSGEYHWSMTVVQEGNKVRGFTTIRMYEDPENYGTITFSGSRDVNGIFVLDEDEVVESVIYPFAYWCIKTITFSAEQVQGKEVLSGDWTADFCGGTSGTIWLERIIL